MQYLTVLCGNATKKNRYIDINTGGRWHRARKQCVLSNYYIPFKQKQDNIKSLKVV